MPHSHGEHGLQRVGGVVAGVVQVPAGDVEVGKQRAEAPRLRRAAQVAVERGDVEHVDERRLVVVVGVVRLLVGVV